jgi:hypothetical protein
MLISEDSFYRLYQQRERELTRELEYRRIAKERMLDNLPQVRTTLAQRLNRRIPGTRRHPLLTTVPSNRP